MVTRSLSALAFALFFSITASAQDPTFTPDASGLLSRIDDVDADGLPTTVEFRYGSDANGNPILSAYRYSNTRPGSCANADASGPIVERYYTTILGRPSEQDGKAYWTGYAVQLCAAGLTPGQAFGQIAAYFFTSPEYVGQNKSTSAFVTDQYVALLDRQPDAGGLSYWVSAIDDYGLPRTAMMDYIIWTAPEYAQLMNAAFAASTFTSPWMDPNGVVLTVQP